MKSLIMYYSYTGNCKKEALKLHEEHPESDTYELKEKKRVGMFATFMINCPKAALRKAVAIQDISINLKDYDKISIVMPIWNSHPAPEFNSLLKLLPAGREVELYMCSGGGETTKSRKGTCDLIEKAGCKLLGYHDIKTAGMTKQAGV